MKVENMDSLSCCGCKACEAVCPNSAIRFRTDAEGFLIPDIIDERCMDCGECGIVCPAISGKRKHKSIISAYAMYWDNNIARERSSSGAVFPALAELFLELGGYVCGSILDKKDFKIRHIVSNTPKIIEKMSDSKYVQSDMSDCIVSVRKLLQQGHYVLASGTSCQINGLISSLVQSGVAMERLLTVDLVCHGVPSPLMFQEWKKFYEQKKKKQIAGYRFRSKRYGWGLGIGDRSYLGTVEMENHEDDRSLAARLWNNVFFSDMVLRECCYTCPYANMNKPADITLGDFWGIESIMPDFDDKKGCSLVLVNSSIGDKWISKLEINKKKVADLKKATNLQLNLKCPSPRPDNRNAFWRSYRSAGFEYVAKEFFNYSMRNRVRYFIKRKLEDMHFSRISDKLFDDILL